MQPSAQGIASLFMGNPGALAARVDQDRKQSPMGIPDDLRQLMALNIVTNETDAAKRQQAMNELQQMAPGGQPPTIADSIRQQATQKIQARMVQEQQRQQALQQMVAGLPAAGIPANVPQPQGIDQAPVEFGMASGGIVSFTNGGSPTVEQILKKDPINRTPEENAILQRAGYQLQRQVVPEDSAVGRAEAAIQQAGAALRRGVAGGTERLSEEELASRPAAGGALNERILRALGAEPAVAPTQPAAQPAEPVFDTSAETEKLRRLAAARTKPAPTPAAAPSAAPSPSVIRDLRDVAQQAAPAQLAAPELQDPRLTRQGFINESEAAKLRERADYEREIGRPNTSALDKLMAEYERQKAATESPTGMAGLVEFMSQIAATPRGMSSLEAGAAGARGAQALERERAAQRALLTEKQIGLEQQKLNANREYSKELFGVGKSAYDKMYDQNLKIYQQQGEDFRQASLFAHQKTQADLANQRQIERDKEQHRYAMIQRGTPTAEMEREERRIKMYMDEQKAKGNTVSYMDAVQAVRGLGGNAGLENAQTRMLREARKDIDDRLEQLQMEGKGKTPEYVQLSQQRKRLSDMIVGRVLKEAGVAGDSSGGVDKSNPLLK